MTDRAYQNQLISDVYQSWGSGARNVLAVLPTGGGKSVCVKRIAAHENAQGARQAIIAHRVELVSQLSIHVATAGVQHRIIAPRNVVKTIDQMHREAFNGRSFVRHNATCTVAGVDTLISRIEELAPWAKTVDRWIIDECFPAGTPVQTVSGSKPIEQIKIGDCVLAFDDNLHSFAWKHVNRLFKNPMPSQMVRIRSDDSTIECTYGHPFWTQRGWIIAGKLTNDDKLLGVREAGSIPQGLRSENLQPGLPVGSIIRDNECNKSSARGASHERTQSDEKGRHSVENVCHTAENQIPSDSARRQRKGNSQSRISAKNDVRTTRIYSSICGQNPHENGARVSDFIPPGYDTSELNACNRSGRQFAYVTGPETAGHDQRFDFGNQGIQSIEIFQSSDIDGSTGGFVYNIEVDDFHTYLAGGVVVHNCHHVLAQNKWGTACTMFPNAYGLGVTATPLRADGQGLGRHADGLFDAMVEGPSMRQLIDMTYLTEYEIACPKSDLEMTDDDITASGDYSPKKLAEASKRSRIVGDVVTQWHKHAFGKQTIVFVTDVETAGKVAANFQAHGIAAAAISAKTPEITRNAWVNKFRTGSLTVLVNVDLFGEGFDVPAVECVVMARPTASLAVYLQQFGRALRPLPGKVTGLIIDMVSNFKRHGWPDRPRAWTLDRRDKRAKAVRDPEDIELTACTECSRPYERCLPACPHCGAEPLPPAGRGGIEQVDGDLVLLDREALAALRAAAELPSPADVHTRAGHAAGPLAAAGAMARQVERIAMQNDLKETIALWAGYQAARGRTDREGYKRFYLTWGMDVLSALALPRVEMETLNAKIREHCK